MLRTWARTALVLYFNLSARARSVFFTSLKRLYSTWDEAELARQISSMRCLIAFARADRFAEGVQFLDHINGLGALERPIKSKKMHLILMSQETIDETLLQNKTNHFNVHMISQGKNLLL